MYMFLYRFTNLPFVSGGDLDINGNTRWTRGGIGLYIESHVQRRGI